jgi:hypothetical protein
MKVVFPPIQMRKPEAAAEESRHVKQVFFCFLFVCGSGLVLEENTRVFFLSDWTEISCPEAQDPIRISLGYLESRLGPVPRPVGQGSSWIGQL